MDLSPETNYLRETNGDKWRQMKIICLLMSPFVSRLSPFVSRSRETNDLTGDKWRQKVEKMDACFVSTTTLHNFERLVFSKMVLLSPSDVLRKGLALPNLNSNRGTCSILLCPCWFFVETLRVWSCGMSVAP